MTCLYLFLFKRFIKGGIDHSFIHHCTGILHKFLQIVLGIFFFCNDRKKKFGQRNASRKVNFEHANCKLALYFVLFSVSFERYKRCNVDLMFAICCQLKLQNMNN